MIKLDSFIFNGFFNDAKLYLDVSQGKGMHFILSLYIILLISGGRRLLQYKKLITTFILICTFALSNNIYIYGTYDLNQNGNIEYFKLNKDNNTLEFNEIDLYSDDKNLWSYSPPNDLEIIDIDLTNLNNDNVPELILLLKDALSNGKISVFEWNGSLFSKYNDPMKEAEIDVSIRRPSNIATFEDIVSISASTPSRSAEVFKLTLRNGVLSVSQKMSFTDTLVTYGYGPIFTGIINNQNKISIALISYEDNFLRASLFPLDGYGKTVRSTEYKMKEDSRILLGPDILTYNNSNQNSNQILIPFTTNEILNLSLENDNVIILENEFNGQDLFGISPNANDAKISDIVFSRVEKGIYNQVLSSHLSMISDSLSALVEDTLMLGDSLQFKIIDDKNSEFYSFNWKTPPPIDMSFNPNALQIEWKPKREDLGIVDLSFTYKIKLDEKIVSSENELGDTHIIQPILEQIDSSLVILIGDTIIPPQPIVILPKRLHSIKINTKDISDSNRFVFEGETPFSSSSYSENGIVTIGVEVNLSTIKNNKSSLFTMQSTGEPPESIKTLSLIHNLSSNSILTEVKPKGNEDTQSLSPENVSSDYYKYPNYVYKGLSSDGMEIQTINQDTIEILKTDKEISGIILLTSPMYEDDHLYEISYYGGRPYAIRGDVKINDDSTQTTITEIDFETSFEVANIKSWLVPAIRDTIIINPDSLPDTLRTKYDYKSFYAPAKILIKEKPSVSDSSAVADSVTLDNDTLTADPEPIPVEDIQPSVSDSSAVADSVK